MDILWYIPTHGDGRYLGSSDHSRPTSLEYLTQVAQAAESLGYTGALIPVGKNCEEPWVVAGALVARTQRLKFLIAQRSAGVSPTFAARLAATLDRLSGGRIAINAVTGADPQELAGDGVYLSHDDRYALTDEFLEIWRSVLRGEKVTYHGRHIKVDDASILFNPVTTPHPPVFFSGSSEPAIDIAARHADVYLTFGEPVDQVKAKIESIRARAAAVGRSIRFGVRLHVIARETESEAWQEAARLISKIKPEDIERAQAKLGNLESVGQARMQSLHQGDPEKLVIAPNLWAGIGLVRGNAGTALVGSGEAIAERLKEYQALGVDTFVLSGYPHLEEAYHFAEHVFPHLNYGVHPASRGEILAHTASPNGA